MARKKKQRIGTIDCETDPFEPGQIVEPFLWGVLLDDGEYREFTEIRPLVDYISQFDGVLYAHNGGKFDYHFLKEDIESDSPISVIAGRVAKAMIGRCEIRDSLNLFGGTRLADFKDKRKASKLEIDYRLMRKGVREKHMDEIRTYLRADCESLLGIVTEFINLYGMNFTQAGSAMKYWHKNHAPKDSDGKGYLPQSSASYFERFRPFYYGGRVQCFESGHTFEKFSVVDINSAYPRAMMEKHPYFPTPHVTSQLPKNEALIPQSLIELEAVSHGALPLRSQKDQSLYFPDDSDSGRVRRYTITGWEYLAGLETGTLKPKRIISCILFGESVDFKDYIQHFYKLRKEAKAAEDKAQDIFAKIFMNALYGKFAANPENYSEYVLSDPDTLAYSKWLESGYADRGPWGGRRMLTRALPESRRRYYNIVTAASITGWVRAFLWKSLLKCHGPLYCDTDSIAARSVSGMDLGPELGQWKLEATCDEWAIAGKKLYAFHKSGEPRELNVKRQMPLTTPDAQREAWKKNLDAWKIACKGADMTPGEIIRVAKGETLLNLAQVPNYSVHRDKVEFINREVKSTYRDIRIFEDAA